MILPDTTVLVDSLRSPTEPLRDRMSHEAEAVTEVTRAEILHGAKSDTDIERLKHALDGFHQIPIGGNTWDHLGLNLYQLRSRGVAIPFPDALIVTIAIDEDLRLWTKDAHFSTIQTVLPALRLLTEPA